MMGNYRPLTANLSTKAPGRSGDKQILGLDIIRCSAAFMVMIFHLGYWFWAGGSAHSGYGGFPVSYEWTAPLLWFGWVGVEVFFVLSGFVIAYSASAASPKAFFRSRLLRLVPAAWICATMTVAIIAIAGLGPTSLLHVIRVWVNTIAFHPFGPWIDWSYWTLGVEISFYTLIFTLLLLKRLPAMPLVVGLIGSCSSVFWLARATASVWRDLAPDISRLIHPSTDFTDRIYDLLLLNHGCFFAIGVFLWLEAFDGVKTSRRMMLLVFVAGGLAEINSRAVVVNRLAGSSFSPIVPCLVWIAFLGMTWASVFFNATLLSRFRRLALTIRGLGLMTYPLYLLHQLIGFTLLGAARTWASDSIVLLMTMIFLVLLAFSVSAYLEPALRRLMSQMLATAGLAPSPANAAKQ